MPDRRTIEQGVCAIAWTQGAVSTGMLAAGATALFGGLGWMLATHAVNKAAHFDAPRTIRSYSFLADLGGWLTFAAAMTTTLILSETSIDYLRFMLGRRPDFWLVAVITIGGGVRSSWSISWPDLSAHQVVARVVGGHLASRRFWRCDRSRSRRSASSLLAIVASWLAVSLNRFPKEWLTVPNTAWSCSCWC